jgi:hypothetical protein
LHKLKNKAIQTGPEKHSSDRKTNARNGKNYKL